MIAAGKASLFPGTKDGEPVQDGSPISLKQLDGLPIILYRRFERILNEKFQSLNINPRLFCVADDARTAMMWAEAGLGIAIAPQSAYRIMPHQNIVYAEIADESLKTRIAAICKKDTLLSAPAKGFLEIFQLSEPPELL